MGSGKSDDQGKVVKPNLNIGDTVLYSNYAGVEFEVSRMVFSYSHLHVMRAICSNE